MRSLEGEMIALLADETKRQANEEEQGECCHRWKGGRPFPPMRGAIVSVDWMRAGGFRDARRRIHSPVKRVTGVQYPSRYEVERRCRIGAPSRASSKGAVGEFVK